MIFKAERERTAQSPRSQVKLFLAFYRCKLLTMRAMNDRLPLSRLMDRSRRIAFGFDLPFGQGKRFHSSVIGFHNHGGKTEFGNGPLPQRHVAQTPISSGPGYGVAAHDGATAHVHGFSASEFSRHLSGCRRGLVATSPNDERQDHDEKEIPHEDSHARFVSDFGCFHPGSSSSLG